MQLIASNEFFMWLAIAAMVLLVSVTGMYINRFMTYRAHRRALVELHRRAMEARPDAVDFAPAPETIR